MMLDVSVALRSPGTEFPFELAETLPDQTVTGEAVSFPEPAVLKGTYAMADDALIIAGRLRTQAHAACARCLRPVVWQVDVPVRETFTRIEPGSLPEEDPWEERLTFSGSRVDLQHLVFTLATLDLPIRFLCGQRCEAPPGEAGERTEGNQKEPPADANPFSALKRLITEFQEE